MKNWNPVIARHAFGQNRGAPWPETPEENPPAKKPRSNLPLPAFGPKPPPSSKKPPRGLARVKALWPDGSIKTVTFLGRRSRRSLVGQVVQMLPHDVVKIRRGGSTFFRKLFVEVAE
ncbi:MAG: hypothetical protein AAB511_04380 [Patescibacteria group bacterium]